MSVLDLVRIVIYRCHEKGLEVFLLDSDLENDPNIWRIPNDVSLNEAIQKSGHSVIELDEETSESGQRIRTLAIEADWHEIPSIRGMVKHDIKLVKSTLKQLEAGTYLTIKDAFKKVLPNEYRALKELKDIILDKNLLNII